MPRVKSLPKRAKTVTRVYDPDTGNRVKITQIDPTKKYTIRFKSGTVQTRKLSEAFLKPRAKQSRYKNLRSIFTPDEIGLSDRALGFSSEKKYNRMLEVVMKGFDLKMDGEPYINTFLENNTEAKKWYKSTNDFDTSFGLHKIEAEIFLQYENTLDNEIEAMSRKFIFNTNDDDYYHYAVKFVVDEAWNQSINLSGKDSSRIRANAKRVRLYIKEVTKV